MSSLPHRTDRRRPRPGRSATRRLAALVEALEPRSLMTQGAFGLLGSGGYGPTLHNFFIDSITSTPPNANQVIDVAPGTLTTTVSLSGHVLGPEGVTPPHNNQQRVRVIGFPLSDPSVVDPPIANRVDFRLNVRGVPLGQSTFVYQASADGSFDPDPQITATITNFTGSGLVTINATPVAVADSFTALKGRSVQGNVLGNDHDGDNSGGANPPDPDGDGNVLTAALFGPAPPNSTLTLNPDGSFLFTPNDPGFKGTVSFQYRVSDGRATPSNGSGPDTTTVTINYNDAPPVVARSFLSLADRATQQVVTARDLLILDVDDPSPTPPTITLTRVPDPQFGSLVLGQGASARVLGVGGTFTQDDVSRGDLAFVRQDLTKTRGSFDFSVSDGTTAVSGVFTVQVSNGVDSPTITQFDDRTDAPTGAAPLLTRDARPTLRGVGAPAGSLIKVFANDNLARAVATGTADGEGTWAATVSAALADGVYTFSATATVGGQESFPGPAYGPVILDTTKPSALTVGLASATDTGAQGDSLTANPNPVLTGTVAADVTPGDIPASRTLKITVSPVGSATPIGQAFVPEAGGSWTIPIPGPLGGGTHTYIVTASDDAGNAVSTSATVVVDPTSPAFGAVSLAPADRDSRASGLPLPVSLTSTPTIQFDLTDQSFSSRPNIVTLAITDLTTGAILATDSFSIAPTATDFTSAVRSLSYTLPTLSPGDHKLQVVAVDLAGNSKIATFELFVNQPSAATPGAPGTPIYATVLDLRALKDANGAPLLGKDQHAFPWSMSFDRTTQTVWVLLRGIDGVSDPNSPGLQDGGNRVVQIDPATQTYRLYDLQDPSIRQQAIAQFGEDRLRGSGPHGAAFDFESHLTPRMWFTQMTGGLVSYIDIAKNQLFVYDIDDALERLDAQQGRPATERHTDVHAIVIDRSGDAWISDQSDNAILELDLSGGQSLDSSTGRLVVHKLPESLVPKNVTDLPNLDSDGAEITGTHGIDVVLDDRPGLDSTGQVTVYFTELGSGSIIRLRPGMRPGAADEWTEYDPKPHISGLPLFTTIDTNETPGDPSDDRIFWGDPAYLGGGSGGGTFIGMLDPANNQITTWTIPPMAGAKADDVSQPNQTFVDRDGNLFYVDRAFGIGRLDVDAAAAAGTSGGPARGVAVHVDPKIVVGAPAEVFANLTPKILNFPTIVTRSFVPTPGSTIEDRSQIAGLDQYDLLGPDAGGIRGAGPFRGTLSAGNVLYGSLTQGDQFASSIFAETARRQVAVALGQGAARMAFQVRRDGHIILTRRDGETLRDTQEDLTASVPNAVLIDGDVSAETDGNGIITVFGIDKATGGLARFVSDATGKAWTVDVLPAPAGALIVGEPVAFVDPARGVGAMVTTAAGHLLVYLPSASRDPVDLTALAGGDSARFYSAVGIAAVGDRVYVYGSNQTGSLLELSYPVAAGPAGTTPADLRVILDASDPNYRARSANDPDHPIVLQGVDVIVDGATRHIFATDGNSQLVHVEVSPGGIKIENVTLKILGKPATELTDADLDAKVQSGQIVGYSNYQRRFAGRVYSELAPVIDPVTKELFVYGTNGRDLVQFHRDGSGTWAVTNLTNSAQSPIGGTPANRVFGAPSAYIQDGALHVLQVNEDGDFVEYQQLAPGLPFSTQNITLAQFPAGTDGNTPASGGPIAGDGNHPTRIGPRATRLAFDAATSTFSANGQIHSARDRHAFQFRATATGRVKIDLGTGPNTVLTFMVFDSRGRRLRKVGPDGEYQIVAGKTYFVLVRGTKQHPSRRGAIQRFGFGSFRLSARQLPSLSAARVHPVVVLGRPFHGLSRPWSTARPGKLG